MRNSVKDCAQSLLVTLDPFSHSRANAVIVPKKSLHSMLLSSIRSNKLQPTHGIIQLMEVMDVCVTEFTPFKLFKMSLAI